MTLVVVTGHYSEDKIVVSLNDLKARYTTVTGQYLDILQEQC